MAQTQKSSWPYNLQGDEQANQCPLCWGEHCVIFVEERSEIDHEKMQIDVINTFECIDCCQHWWQTITYKLGDAIANKAEFE